MCLSEFQAAAGVKAARSKLLAECGQMSAAGSGLPRSRINGMNAEKLKTVQRRRRKLRVRKRVRGTAERPRLTVFRSLRHIYAQLIDDDAGVTLCSASSRSKAVRDQLDSTGNTGAAKAIGTALAEQAKTQGVTRVCFDRNGYRYHGRIRALAEAVREGGMEF